MTSLLNSKFGWAECLPVIIGGSTRVNVTVVRANFGNNQGTAAVFLILDLNWWWLHHRLFSTQPHHLRVRISCQNRSNHANLLLFVVFISYHPNLLNRNPEVYQWGSKKDVHWIRRSLSGPLVAGWSVGAPASCAPESGGHAVLLD